MRLKLKKIEIESGVAVAFLNKELASRLDLNLGDRLEISYKNKKTISIVDFKSTIKNNEISFSDELMSFLNIHLGEYVDVTLAPSPKSKEFIVKKMYGKELSKSEIHEIINDISQNALTEAEISYFILSVYDKGMSFKETIYLTEAMCNTGRVIKWPSKYTVVDKHCIGGIPGNRTTPIVVSICSAAGLIMPKTSSRAITSAAGTADTMETLCNVDLSVEQLQSVVKKTGACLAWGGSLGLAPSDDKLIRVERMLNLDPESQLLASIISKKLAAGSKNVVVDIPAGNGAKVSKSEAINLSRKFTKVLSHFKVNSKIIITDGSEPIGNGVGPLLEMLDVLRVLKRENAPQDLEEKSLLLAGEILELVGKARKGGGYKLAKEILDSKQAYKKFMEITSAQGLKNSDLSLAKFNKEIKSSKKGKLKSIDNFSINHISRILGCPSDKKSGVYIHKHCSEKVSLGDPLITLYAESEKKLKEAIAYCNSHSYFVIN